MKKYLIALFVILGGACAINPAEALSLLPVDACVSCGTTAGATCGSGGGISSGNASCAMLNRCSGGSCKYVSCNGNCICADSTYVCDTEVTFPEVPACSNTPTWGAINTSTGVQTGTCTISGKTTTIYRCADGYYTRQLLTLGASTEYATSAPECTICPKHADDVSSSQPTYVSTDGGGLLQITKCKVKANTEIQGDVGKFVFESGCTYQ